MHNSNLVEKLTGLAKKYNMSVRDAALLEQAAAVVRRPLKAFAKHEMEFRLSVFFHVKKEDMDDAVELCLQRLVDCGFDAMFDYDRLDNTLREVLDSENIAHD